jgi:predicted TIM-barrel fold metal-dependent hydrolase
LANRFPDLKLIIAHLGHPWQREAVMVVRKHRNVFADVSGMWHRPWEGFNALLSAIEWGVTGKLLFGSDYPIWTPQFAMEKLTALPQQFHNFGLPRISNEVVDDIIHRNAFELLAIHPAASRTPKRSSKGEVKS